MERRSSIDYLRIVSAMAVVIIHTVSAPVVNGPEDLDAALVAQLNLVHTLMNWAVPVFFMISGYCVLRRAECTCSYCFRHVGRFVCVLFTVGLLYGALEEVYTTRQLNWLTLPHAVRNVITGDLWDHMWFVYAIIGVYLVMPVLHAFLRQGERNGWILTALLFLSGVLFPSLERWIAIPELLPMGGHLFYVCFGAMAARHDLPARWRYLIYGAGALSCIRIVLGADTQAFGYQHVAVCFMAMSIFLLISRMNLRPAGWASFLARCT